MYFLYPRNGIWGHLVFGLSVTLVSGPLCVAVEMIVVLGLG